MDTPGIENIVSARPGFAANLFLPGAYSPLMSPEPCFNRIWSDIILKDATPRRADNRVRKACREHYLITPGYVFRGVTILIERPMLVGIDEEAGRILMPFRKPCYGTSLYAIESDRVEIAALREALSVAEPENPGKKIVDSSISLQPGGRQSRSLQKP